MTKWDYVVVGGIALVAAGLSAVGWAVRMVAIGVDEAIGLMDRRR